MKRFTMKSKHWGKVVVLVDDEDAYLLRSHVWTCSGTQTPQVARKVNGASVMLSHVIADAQSGEWVRHISGDQLDFRKENLAIEVREKKDARAKA